jgi:HKD family nuclease
MRVEILTQTDIGGMTPRCVGDVLNEALEDLRHEHFLFAVAYMRKSGINCLSSALQRLAARSGSVSGAVGVGNDVTSLEALQTLKGFSGTSALFYTVSKNIIYHPKLYLVSGAGHALAVLGSSNFTYDGLNSNIEAATVIEMDLGVGDDQQVFTSCERFIRAFLETAHPNVKPLNDEWVARLVNLGLVKPEAQTREEESSDRREGSEGETDQIRDLFPPIAVRLRSRAVPIRQAAVAAPEQETEPEQNDEQPRGVVSGAIQGAKTSARTGGAGRSFQKEVTANDIRAGIISLPPALHTLLPKDTRSLRVAFPPQFPPSDYRYNRARKYIGGVTNVLRQFGLLGPKGERRPRMATWIFTGLDFPIEVVLR